MKILKLNLIWILAFAFTLGSCENENFTEDIDAQEIETGDTSKHPKVCNINFAKKLNYSITILNRNGQKRTFAIPKKDTDIAQGFAILIFEMTPERRNQPFFKAGIKSYTFSSNKALDKEVSAAGAVVTRAGNFSFQKESVFKRGKKFNYRANVRQRISKNVDFLQVSFNVNKKQCFLF